LLSNKIRSDTITKLPRLELEEMGPSLDLVIKRTKFATKEMMKAAMRTPREVKPRKVKNVSTTSFAKLGTVHKEKQDLNTMQTRKVKALKRKRADPVEQGGESLEAFAATGEAKSNGNNNDKNADNKKPQQQPKPKQGGGATKKSTKRAKTE